MKKIIYAALALFPLLSAAQQVAWTQTISYSTGQGAKSIAFDQSNNLYMAGHFYESYNQNGTHGTYIHKYKTTGELLWMDSIRANGIPVCGGMCLDQLGNIYTSMARPASNINNTYIWINGVQYPGGYGYVIKYNSSGQVMWVSNIGLHQYPLSTAIDNAGNILITGHTGNNCFAKRINSSGTIINSYTLCGTSIVVDQQNNMFVTESDTLSNKITKYNASGVYQWSYNVNTADFKICPDHNGNIFALLCGLSGNSTLVKLDGSGAVLWSKAVPYAGCALSCDANNLYIVENTAWTKGRTVMEINKYDFSGNLLWSYRVPDSYNYDGSGILFNQGSYYVSARGNEVLNAYLMRVDEVGIPTAINENEIRSGLNIYPNPARIFHITYKGDGKQNMKLKIFDLTGRCVMEKSCAVDGDLNEDIDMSAYAKGVYQLQIKLNNQSAVKKLVVE